MAEPLISREAVCRCGKLIRLAPGGHDDDGEALPPYWYHPEGSTIWCGGWGAGGQVAAPAGWAARRG